MRNLARLSSALASLTLTAAACSGGTDVIGLDSGGGPEPDSGVEADAGGSAADSGGFGVGRVVLSEAQVDFGLVIVNTTASHILTISNPGLESVRVVLSEPEGPGAARFTRTVQAPLEGGAFVIPPGVGVEVAFTASPTALGPIEASLTLDSCNGTCTSTIGLHAAGANTGVICPDAIDFGLANPGTCVMREIECENLGNVPERITAAELEPTSAAAFMAVERALPITFAPGTVERFAVRFCPPAADEYEGDYLVQSFMPAQVQHAIHLVGEGGGPDVRCTPETLAFGTVGIGAAVSQSVTCTNRGTAPTDISGRIPGGAAFALTRQPMGSTAPGQSAVFVVEVNAMMPGAQMSELVITTGDPDTNEVTVPLSAELIRIENCTATLSPPSRDFGLVAPGDRRTTTFTLANTGMTSCLIRSVQLGPQSNPSFSVVMPPPPGFAIPAGQSLQLTVSFAPTAVVTARGSIAVAFSNPGTMDLTATLAGSGGTLPVVIQPASVDFGAVATTCAAPVVQRVVLRGLGAATMLVRAQITGTGSSAFSLQTLMLPQAIPPFALVNVDVAFRPRAMGTFDAELRLEVGMAGAIAIVPLHGTGAGTPARSDTFTTGTRKLDILLVLEDSRGTGPTQAALAEQIPSFLSRLRARGVDFHIAVITSDMDSAMRSGRMLGQPAVLTPMTMGLEATLRMRVQPGNGGSATEQPLQAALTALTPPLATGANNGFLRTDADLAVIVIGGEDDTSPAMPPIETYLATIRRAAGTGRLSFSGVIGPPATACFGPLGAGSPSPRLHEAITRAGNGIAANICETMERSLRRIGERTPGAPAFPLSAEPVPSTLRVVLDGAPVPAIDASGARTWAYEPVTRRVLFTSTATIPSGRPLSIAYDAFCLSPTCGNGSPEAGEACDDGNTDFGDACTAGCRAAVCGDGRLQSGVEACDDANLDDNDACLSCVASRCGDGVIRAGMEDCDDGNAVSGDGCPADCRLHDDVSAFYTVSALMPATYVPLAMPTVLMMDNDDGSTTFQLPYTFRFFGGVPTTTITVTPNGVASTGPLPSTSNYQNSAFPSRAAPNGVMAVWWDDLLIDNMVMGGADVSYQVLGMAPNRTTVIQWRNVRPVNHSRTNNRRFHFQLVLAETTSVIRYQYGETQTSGNPPTASSASGGIENVDATAGQDLLACSPGCEGPPRPGRANGFPAGSALSLTPVP